MIKEAQYRLGDGKNTRLLPRGEAYGKLDLLINHEKRNPHWDSMVFSQPCAGCHTTGLDSRLGAFVSASIDCYSCHDPTDLSHAKDTSKVLFSDRRKMTTREVASVCGQCHARNGHSKITGKPYPFNYISLEDLFADFQPVLIEVETGSPPNIDRHALLNLEDIMVGKKDVLDCPSCHVVRTSSHEKHESLETRGFYFTHLRGRPKSKVYRLSRKNKTCQLKGTQNE